jgi:hypothetical protein
MPDVTLEIDVIPAQEALYWSGTELLEAVNALRVHLRDGRDRRILKAGFEDIGTSEQLEPIIREQGSKALEYDGQPAAGPTLDPVQITGGRKRTAISPKAPAARNADLIPYSLSVSIRVHLWLTHYNVVMKVSRRRLAKVLAVGAPAALTAQAQQAPADAALEEARAQLRFSAQAVTRVILPASTEPAFKFEPRG